MKCDDYKRLIHLNRAGEISKREDRKLNRHLRTCISCSSDRELIKSTDAFMSKIKSFQPVFKHSDKLTDSIIARIKNDPSDASTREHISIPYKIIYYFERPMIQFASILFIVVATALFVVQYIEILRSVDHLGIQFAHSVAEAKLELTYSISTEQADHIMEQNHLGLYYSQIDKFEKDNRVYISQDNVISNIDKFEYTHIHIPDIDENTIRRTADQLINNRSITYHFKYHGV